MIEQQKGDPKALQGSVIIYGAYRGEMPSKFKGAEVIYPGAFATNDIIAFAEETGMSFDTVEEIIKQALSEVTEAHPGGTIENRIFSTPVVYTDKEEVMSHHLDVLYLGEFSALEKVWFVASQAAMVYGAICSEQWISLGKEITDELGEEAIPMSPRLMHRQVAGENIYEHIMQTYVIPIVHYMETGQIDHAKAQAEQMLSFAHGAPYLSGINSLCQALFLGNLLPQHTELIDCHVRKIEAICTEDYEKAMKMQRRIEKILING
jgi:hypothetical protein